MAEKGMNFNEIMQVLQEFLEVAIHNILYLRAVYPPDLFEKFKKYNVPVYKARHPQLSSYVAEVVRSAMENIVKGLVKKLLVVIKDATTDEALEHFVFSLLWVKPLAFFENEAAVKSFESGMSRADAELMLRSFLLKMSNVDAQLGNLKEDLTFSVVIELLDDVNMPHQPPDEPNPWLPASIEEERVNDEMYKNSRLHALKWTQFGILDLSLQVEESPGKTRKALQEGEMLSSNDTESQRYTTAQKGKGKGT